MFSPITMARDPKFIAARARLNALSTHLPSFVYEQDVADYHEILDVLEESSSADLSSFRIPPQKMDYPIVGAVRGSYSGGRGRLIHGSKKQCDHSYFAAQITAVREFLAEIQNSAVLPSPRPRDYWSMTDEALAALAEQLHIVPQLRPYVAGPGRSVAIDREKIIRQLVQRDKALSVDSSPGVSVNILGNVHGSTIQAASPNANATTSSAPNLKTLFEIISKLKSEKGNLDLQDSSRDQFDSDIEMIESEMRATEPRHSVIVTYLLDLKAILLNVGGGVIANAIWQQVNSYLSSHP
jgi:hypothetical protein